MKQFHTKNLKKDLFSGLVVALVSIPISMGYAQIAGLPPVYGLYGSLLPILVFSLLTTSPQFIVGVDAMPAAMVGGTVAAMGLVPNSPEAMALVPVTALLTALWFLVFYGVNAGRVVNYISTPVMGGFISGVASTIILMQVPKLFGGTAGTGELIPLLYHIGAELPKFNLLSALLGFGTVAVILTCKRFFPKFPMAIVMMAVGALLTVVFPLQENGVALLPAVEGGLPKLHIPDLSILNADNISDLIFLSMTIALVIMAQSLLATNNYASRYDDQIDNRRELLAYAAMNAVGCAVGCCPINGSVSRTGMADQFGGRSQVMSLTASGVMLVVLLFGTGLLQYLPVPVLTGIVMTALIGILETKLAKRLWKVNKNEFFIFLAAFLGVLFFGTIYGVMIGVVLSFVDVTLQAVNPPRAFQGMMPGHGGLYNLKRNPTARPIAHTLIYRFNGNLFFANFNTFERDILEAIQPDTKQVIVDGRGIGSIDITAAERLVALHRKLKHRGIRFYLTEHEYTVNDQLRAFGGESLIHAGAVRRTWSLALRESGMEKPYPLEGAPAQEEYTFIEGSERLAELQWAFGAEAEEKLHQLAEQVAQSLLNKPDDHHALEQAERMTSWGRIGLYDEEELLDYLELHFTELADAGQLSDGSAEEFESQIEERRRVVEEKLRKLNPTAFAMLQKHRQELIQHLRSARPEVYQHLEERKARLHQRLIEHSRTE